ncbi:MAG: xylulokinase [Sciscionella sp.]
MAGRSDDVFMGLDLGTSGLKGVAVSTGGELMATASAGYETARPLPGRAEQDPEDWFSAVAAVVTELTARIPPARWAGIGLSGMLPTLVLAGRDGAPVGPAITWEDGRADPDGERYRDAVGADTLYRETGQWVDGRYLMPMVHWLAREDPSRIERAAWIMGAKDHLFFRLTGEVATDPSTAAGFGCYALATGRFDPDLAGTWSASLPTVRPSSFVGGLRADVAEALGLTAGVPVSVGAADSVCGALGVGAIAAGDRVSLWGTSTAIIGVHDDLLLDPAHRYLVTPLALGEGWGLEMDLVSTGSAIAWLASLLEVSEPDLFRLAALSPLGANGASFLPYLGPGEQGALWDPSLHGTLGRLTLTHTRADVARALLEGIALEVRRCVRVLDDAGVAPGPTVVAGGAAGSAIYASMLAGAIGSSVTTVEDGRWMSARGAGIVSAASSAGSFRPEALDALARSTIEPRTEDAAIWDELAERHEDQLRRARSK